VYVACSKESVGSLLSQQSASLKRLELLFQPEVVSDYAVCGETKPTYQLPLHNLLALGYYILSASR